MIFFSLTCIYFIVVVNQKFVFGQSLKAIFDSVIESSDNKFVPPNIQCTTENVSADFGW
jgi:hypothetical protein